MTDILQAKSRKEVKDILTDGYSPRVKASCLAMRDCAPARKGSSIFHRSIAIGMNTAVFKDKAQYEECLKDYMEQSGGKKRCPTSRLENRPCYSGLRYLNARERELCQGVPVGYTDCLSENEAADVLGDGWCVPVIADIFGGMK